MPQTQAFQNTQRTYEELIASFKTNAIATIATSIKEQTAPFLRDKEVEQMPRAYNAATGMPISGLNALMLDIKKAQMKYEENAWINLTQAKIYGASDEDIAKTQENWQNNSVKIHYIQTKEKVPTFSNKPLLDENGNQRLLKDGSPAFEFARNENNQVIYETKEITPILREERLYNIASFPSIDRNKLKELNREVERKHIYRHLKQAADKNTNNTTTNGIKGVILEDIAQSLHPTTREQIETYFKAQNYGKAYNVPTALNERQKEQVNTMINDSIKKLKKAKALDNVYKYLQGQNSDVSDFKFKSL